MLTFLGAASVAVVLFVVGVVSADMRSDDLSFELAKAGIQLFAIAILGGAVAAAFRILDERREARRRLDDYRAATAAELIDAYNSIKAVRRTLRAAGFRAPTSGEVSAQQRDDFRAQMDKLVDSQLTLEKFARDVGLQTDAFEPYAGRIRSLIRKAEHYVGEVIADWEKHGHEVKEGADLASVTGRLAHLQAFLGKARDPRGLKESVSEPLAEAARVIQSLRLRGHHARVRGSSR